jgi:methionyl-tRNA formyltransferase
MDTGPILTRRTPHPGLPHRRDSGGGAVVGAQLLAESLKGYLAGDLRLVPQEGSLATYAPA